MYVRRITFTVRALTLAALVGLVGCYKAPEPTGDTDPKQTKKVHDHSGWWCGEHGIPEHECSMCSGKVAADYKKKGEWCEKHDRALPQCFVCNPKQQEFYAAKYFAKYGKKAPPLGEPLPVDKEKDAKDKDNKNKNKDVKDKDVKTQSKKIDDHSAWWCSEHGIPEHECSMCGVKAAADFKKKGDWCDKHDRALSQCFVCNPKQQEFYATKYFAKYGKKAPPLSEPLPVDKDKDAKKKE